MTATLFRPSQHSRAKSCRDSSCRCAPTSAPGAAGIFGSRGSRRVAAILRRATFRHAGRQCRWFWPSGCESPLTTRTQNPSRKRAPVFWSKFRHCPWQDNGGRGLNTGATWSHETVANEPAAYLGNRSRPRQLPASGSAIVFSAMSQALASDAARARTASLASR